MTTNHQLAGSLAVKSVIESLQRSEPAEQIIERLTTKYEYLTLVIARDMAWRTVGKDAAELLDQALSRIAAASIDKAMRG